MTLSAKNFGAKLFSLIACGAVAALGSAQSAQAQSTTVFDFDNTGLSDGDVVTNQIAGLSIMNGSVGYEGGAVTGFYSGVAGQHDAVFDSKLTEGASFSGGFLTYDTLFSPENLEIGFDDIFSGLSFTVADIEGGEQLTASVFDQAGNMLDSQMLSSSTAGTGNGSGVLVSFDVDGISRLVLDPSTANNPNGKIGYAIDNLVGETAQSVPEPASMLSLLAVGALGATKLRKRQPES